MRFVSQETREKIRQAHLALDRKGKATCKTCSKDFRFYKRGSHHNGIYCSRKCAGVGHRKNNFEHYQKVCGSDLGYRQIHTIISKKLGRPKLCTRCKKQEIIKKRTNIHWANISGNYTLNDSDWIALCVSCHKNYDLRNIKI